VEDHSWSVNSYGYYDSNRRYLLINGHFVGAFFDGIELKDLSISYPKQNVILRYPNFGYFPIEATTLPSGITLSEKDILNVLTAEVVKNMQAQIPSIEHFSDPYSTSVDGRYCLRVDYKLKSVPLKNWFDAAN
jgi:hypothetical protein